MSDRLETVVVVTDKGSQTFTKVGDSATKMGTSIDKATTTGSKGLTNLSKAGAAAGAAFATLSGTLTLAAHANAEAEQSQARLTAAIEATGHVTEEYQSQINAAAKAGLDLAFDDEDVLDAISQLTLATGDASKGIKDMALAEDIARGRGIALTEAARIVGLAEQGRTGTLIRLGIQIDKNATKEQALAALQQRYAGQAQAYSETSAAGFDRLQNSAENALEAIGAHLGPAQELLMVLPGLSAGFSGVGAAVGALAPEMTAATAAGVALDLALGPVGIALAAVGAGIAIYELSGYLKDDFSPAADGARSGLDKLNASLNAFIQASSPLSPLAKQTTDDLKYITDATANYQQRLHDLTNEQEQAQQEYDSYSQIRAADTKGIEERRQKLDSLNATLTTLRGQQGLASVSAAELTKATESANAVLNDTGPAGEAARNQLKYLDDSVQDGTTSWVDYIKGVNDLAGALPAMNIGMIEAAGGVKQANDAALKGKLALTDYTAAFKAMNVQAGDLNALMGAAVPFVRDYTNQLTGAGQGAKFLGDQFTDMADGAGSAGDALIAETKAQNDANVAAAAGGKAFLEAAQSIGTLDTELERLIAADVSTWAERTANRVLKSTEGLDSLMSVIIDGTKNLSGQSQNLNDWAIDLINVAGSYGKIDDLLAHGQISLTTYNQAQEAGTRIFADNAAVQEDLLRIQAKQAPILADNADAQAKYIDQLADLPPQQQLVALGWMDQNEAMKANAALALAAAAANGEYGDAGEAAATAAITAQARADPAFAAMLEDMGVISVGADGTITVNFPTADKVHQDTVNLTASIDALTIALGGIPPNVNSNVTVSGVDSASAAVAGYSYLLDTVNGKSVYTSVYVDALGPGLRLTPGYALGGIVPHAQNGMMGDGRTVIVGEAGPEMVKLPGGSLVYPSGASKEMMRDRAGGGNIIVHNMTVVANNPRDFSDQMRSFNFGYGARS